MTKETVNKIARVIRDDNPNLIVISDSVYANFVEEYYSLQHEVVNYI